MAQPQKIRPAVVWPTAGPVSRVQLAGPPSPPPARRDQLATVQSVHHAGAPGAAVGMSAVARNLFQSPGRGNWDFTLNFPPSGAVT